MAKKNGWSTKKILWYGAGALIGYIILDKLGIIDQVRSQLGAGAGTAVSNVARVNYAYTSQERDRRWLNTQYPEMQSYIGSAYGQGSQSMSGEYNSIPYAFPSI